MFNQNKPLFTILDNDDYKPLPSYSSNPIIPAYNLNMPPRFVTSYTNAEFPQNAPSFNTFSNTFSYKHINPIGYKDNHAGTYIPPLNAQELDSSIYNNGRRRRRPVLTKNIIIRSRREKRKQRHDEKKEEKKKEEKKKEEDEKKKDEEKKKKEAYRYVVDGGDDKKCTDCKECKECKDIIKKERNVWIIVLLFFNLPAALTLISLLLFRLIVYSKIESRHIWYQILKIIALIAIYSNL